MKRKQTNKKKKGKSVFKKSLVQDILVIFIIFWILNVANIDFEHHPINSFLY